MPCSLCRIFLEGEDDVLCRRIALLKVVRDHGIRVSFLPSLKWGPIPFSDDHVRYPIRGLRDSEELASCFVDAQCAIYLL